MSLYKMFDTNKEVEQTGIILEYGSNSAGKPIRFRIARAGGNNVRFAKLMEKKTKAYRRQIANETLDPKVAESIFMDVYAESVVLGWENVEDKDGNEIKYTPESCLKLFKDLPDLFADIREQASKMALFQSEVREIEAKN